MANAVGKFQLLIFLTFLNIFGSFCANINEPCSYSSDCSSQNSHCILNQDYIFSGKCTCRDGFYFDQIDECRTLEEIGEYCQATDQYGFEWTSKINSVAKKKCCPVFEHFGDINWECGPDGKFIGGPNYDECSKENEQPFMICYWAPWYYYKSDANFRLEDIRWEFCTHLIYSDLGLKELNLTDSETPSGRFKVQCKDPNLDMLWGENNTYCYSENQGNLGILRKLTQLRDEMNPEMKIMISVGGWNNEPGQPDLPVRFSAMAKNYESRRFFMESLDVILKEMKLDGFILDWNKPDPESKENYTLFLKEFREFETGIGSKYLIFNTANVLSPEITDSHWDLPNIHQYLDKMIILGYNMINSTDQIAHHSPLFPNPKFPEESHLNLDSAVKHFISKDIPANKIVISVPLFGKSFEIEGREMHNFHDPAIGPGKPMFETLRGGELDFYEICYYLPKDCPRVELHLDPDYQVPYAYHDSYWVGFDDVQSGIRKSQYVLDRYLGGIMIFSIEKDDCPRFGLKYLERKPTFCDLGDCPFLNAVNSTLYGINRRNKFNHKLQI